MNFHLKTRVVLWIAISLAWLNLASPARATDCAEIVAPSVPAAGVVRTPALEDGPVLILISAPSGGGKTTLALKLLQDFANLKLSVSTTTRAPRGQEVDGVDYFFLSQADFRARVDAGEFAEWTEVHGNFYGTQLATIQNEFARGNSVISLVDVKGAEKLRKKFAGRVYSLFIVPPSLEVLRERLVGRGTDSEAAIDLRMKNAIEEMSHAKDSDQVVINDDLEVAHAQLVRIFQELRLVPTPLK